MTDWGVFEYRTGATWHVTPPTEPRARYEATQAGTGHEAFPFEVCLALSNAFAHGRRRGHEEAADQARLNARPKGEK